MDRYENGRGISPLNNGAVRVTGGNCSRVKGRVKGRTSVLTSNTCASLCSITATRRERDREEDLTRP